MATWHGKAKKHNCSHKAWKRKHPCISSATGKRSHKVKYVNMDAVVKQYIPQS